MHTTTVQVDIVFWSCTTMNRKPSDNEAFKIVVGSETLAYLTATSSILGSFPVLPHKTRSTLYQNHYLIKPNGGASN